MSGTDEPSTAIDEPSAPAVSSHFSVPSTARYDAPLKPLQTAASGVRPGPLPPPQRLPGPDAKHKGWDPSTVSTAKCDMCHQPRRGTVQKCSQCKLSVCFDCAVAGRLRVDTRHELDPDAVDWTTTPTSATLRRLRADRSARSGRRRVARAPQPLPRGRTGRTLPPSAPSRTSSTSVSPLTSPRTDTGSLDEDHDSSGGDRACYDNEQRRSPQLAPAAPRQQPATPVAEATSPASTQAVRTRDAAETLTQMPRLRPWSAAEQQQKHRSYGSTQSVLLPPVRSVPDPRQSGVLPPLRALHPQLGIERALLQAPGRGSQGLSALPQGSPWALTHHAEAALVSQRGDDRAPLYLYTRAQGQSSCNAQLPQQPHAHANQNGPRGPPYCGESKEPTPYRAPSHPSTAHHTLGLPAIPRSTNIGDYFSSYKYGTYSSSGHACYRQGHVSPSGYYAPRAYAQEGTPRAGIHEAAPQPTSRPHAPFSLSIQEQGAELLFSAHAVQAAEHPQCTLDQCLRLVLTRKWAQRAGGELRADQRQQAFAQLRAAANIAVLELGLPEQHSLARTWLREQQLVLDGGEPERSLTLNIPSPLHCFDGLLSTEDIG